MTSSPLPIRNRRLISTLLSSIYHYLAVRQCEIACEMKRASDNLLADRQDQISSLFPSSESTRDQAKVRERREISVLLSQVCVIG